MWRQDGNKVYAGAADAAPAMRNEETMDVLETLRQWLLTFPQWEAGNLLYIDYTDAVPGNLGLYPAGLEILSSSADVAGNVTLRCRYNFVLYRMGSACADGRDAAWLLAFQNWVLEQSLAGLAPVFGEEPALERIRAEKGKLKETSQPGTGVYAVVLTAEFVRKF